MLKQNNLNDLHIKTRTLAKILETKKQIINEIGYLGWRDNKDKDLHPSTVLEVDRAFSMRKGNEITDVVINVSRHTCIYIGVSESLEFIRSAMASPLAKIEHETYRFFKKQKTTCGKYLQLTEEYLLTCESNLKNKQPMLSRVYGKEYSF